MFSRHVGVTFLLALLCAVVRGNGATVPELNDPEGQVVRLEYFFDQDPGEGDGISLDFSTHEQGGIELNLDLPLEGLSMGMHQLFIRAQNGRDEWSITSKHAFFVTPFATRAVPFLERGEYFFGEDPGEGNGISVLPNDASEGAASFDLEVPPMPAGHHALKFRAQDSFGNWSFPVQNTYLQLPDIRATGVEWSVLEGEEVLGSGIQAIEPPASRYAGTVITPLLADASFNQRSLQAEARLILVERIPSFTQTIDLQIQAVGDPLRIITPPQNQTVSVGDQLRLSLVVNQSENLSFQWFKDGVAVPGATSSLFTIPVIGLEDAGNYSVSISDSVQEVLSDAAMVQVSGPIENAPPTITLIGDALLELSQGATYTEPGVSATDPEDGDLTNAVAVSGLVDTSSPGSYILEYAVTDAGGLTTAMIREVIVRTPSNVPNGMVLIEDLGPVGIGNDKDNLSLQSIDSFYMDIHEVAKGLWDEVREWGLANGYTDLPEGTAGHEGDATHPVTEISWYDMVKWCNARSEMEGMRPAYFLDDAFSRAYRNREELSIHVDPENGYRLPTEVQWEKAARGGRYANEEKTKGFDYPWGSDERTPQDANYGADGDHTTPVGSYPPNAYGLYDMSGNVWERCFDQSGWWEGDKAPLHRVMRGGSWVNLAGKIYSSFINGLSVDSKDNYVGFRTVLPPGHSGSPSEHPPIHLTLVPPSEDVPFYRLRWASQAGVSYSVEKVDALWDDWLPAEPQPVVAVSDSTEWAFEADGSAMFFRVRTTGSSSGGGGEATRVDLKPFPRNGDFGIPQLASIAINLPDHDAVNAASIRLTVGSLGTFGVDDAALFFEQGTLTFDPSLAGALGDHESMVSAQVGYADQDGNQYTYDWSFRIQKQTILSGDVFVLGSPQAQFQGQALNPRQLAIYEDLGVTPSAFAIRQQTGNAPWSLDEVKDDSLIFSYEGDTPPNFQVGQYLANLTPAKKDEIFYRKVAVVLKDVPEKQKVSVFTKDVGLLEIFVQASMLSHPVGFPAAVYAIAQEGFLVNASQGFLLESPIKETWSPEPGVDLTLSGNISIEPKLSLSLDIQGSTVEDFYLRQDGKMTTSLGASLKVTESRQWETATEDPIFSADRVFYLGQVGVVPIWLDMEFEVNAEAEASYEAAGEISTGIQTTYDYWSELVYSTRNPSLSGMFASPPSRQLVVSPLKVTLEGHAEAAVRLVPELTMELESLFGVRVDLTPEVGLKGDVSFVNGEMETAAFELYGRLDLNAGLSIEGIEDDLLPQIEPVELVYWPWKFLYPGYQFEITRQPEGGRFTKGEEVLLRVDVDVLHESFDPEDIRYQWHKDGILLSGETEPLLRIDEFSENEEGEYWVEVWKEGEQHRVTSNVVRVSEGIRWGDARLVELKTIKGTSIVDFSEFTVSKPPQDLVELPSSSWNLLTSTFNPTGNPPAMLGDSRSLTAPGVLESFDS